MGIDFIIHYDCEPKNALALEGLMGRLKGRDRANAIIQLYRVEGDTRSPSQMGFEMVRRTADGTEETEVIVVQQLLDAAEELRPWEHHCTGCPANRTGVPFGCVGTINYPVSTLAERWLLDQLPDSDHPLVYMLLQRALRDLGYSGQAATPLREQEGVFLENPRPLERDFGGGIISGDQVFEMLFLSGPIQPAHGALILQFFGGISPDLDADVMMLFAAPPSPEWIAQHAPFQHVASVRDDESIEHLKAFFRAIYIAFGLGVPVLLDI
ncbi:MAG: hypothetical protein JW966_11755 [Anaerolineae bacterium]|nr:hypothetical protein [Anaerolineae bacterium]